MGNSWRSSWRGLGGRRCRTGARGSHSPAWVECAGPVPDEEVRTCWRQLRVSPAAGSERTGAVLGCGWPSARRDGLLPVDFTKNGREYGLVGRSTVLLPDRAEHTLAAGLSHQLVQDAVVNLLAACQLVVCDLRDLRHAGMSSRLIQDHERCVLEVHARESMTVPGEGVRGISQVDTERFREQPAAAITRRVHTEEVTGPASSTSPGSVNQRRPSTSIALRDAERQAERAQSRSACPGVGDEPGRGQLRFGLSVVAVGYVLRVAAGARGA